MMKPTIYRGYTITYDPNAPITGKWRAVRFGVGMCANTREMLIRMIDQKLFEQARS